MFVCTPLDRQADELVAYRITGDVIYPGSRSRERVTCDAICAVSAGRASSQRVSVSSSIGSQLARRS